MSRLVVPGLGTGMALAAILEPMVVVSSRIPLVGGLALFAALGWNEIWRARKAQAAHPPPMAENGPERPITAWRAVVVLCGWAGLGAGGSLFLYRSFNGGGLVLPVLMAAASAVGVSLSSRALRR